MDLEKHYRAAPSDRTLGSICSSRIWLQYQTSMMPAAFEPAPVSRQLSETILCTLDRDDRLRWAYLRRRWQGLRD
jgi:hypothetical protein